MADFRYPFPLRMYLFNRGIVSSKNYKPLIDDIHFTTVIASSSNIVLQGQLDGISGLVDVVPVVAGTNVSLQGSLGDLSGSVNATLSEDLVLQGGIGDISGQIVSNPLVNASLQSSIGEISGQLVANTQTSAFIQGSTGDLSGVINAGVQAIDATLQGSLGEISGFIDVGVTNTPLDVIRVSGAGRKSNKKALTHKERKELDEKVFEILFDLAKDVADKADINSSLVTSDVVSTLVNDVINDVRTGNISKVMLEESAKLQTDFILRNLRRKQRNRQDEELMLLF